LSFCDLKQNKNHILKKWRENKTTPWLIAALAVSTKHDTDTNTLIESADKLSINSPGYLTAQYYLITLLTKSDNKNDKAIAKTKIDQILQHPPSDMTPSARNIFLAERQKLASTLDEYIHYALKQPVAEIADPSYKILPDDYDQIEKGNNF